MAKKQLTSPNNYLKLNMRLKAAVLRIKELAKEQTGRTFGTHAIRGTAAYERMIRETLDVAIKLTNKDKLLKPEEKVMVRDRLIHDYEYGFKMREQERIGQDVAFDQPVMDRAKLSERAKEIEELKRESIRRTTEKFMRYRNPP